MLKFFTFQFIIFAVKAGFYNVYSLEEPGTSHSSKIWHSYEFDTGIGNREELHINKAELNKTFLPTSDIYKIKSLSVHGEVIIFGLSSNFVLLGTLNNKNELSIYKEEIAETTNDFNVFQLWNAKSQKIESYLVVSVSRNGSNILKWYKFQNGKLMFLCDWSLHKLISFLDIIKVNYESKLLIISHEKDTNKNCSTTTSLDIYNFIIEPKLNVWLDEKIDLGDVPSSVTVFNENDNTFLCASFPSTEVVKIWRFSKNCLLNKEQKHFNFHQSIFSKNVKNVISFQSGYTWHIAISGENSSIYELGDDFMFHNLSNLNLGYQDYWFLIPLNNYREENILLSRSSRNNEITGVIWAGNKNFKIIKNFTKVICENDLDCLREFSTNISIHNSTTFKHNDCQNIVILTSGFPLLLKFYVALRPLPDKAILKLQSVIRRKNKLEKNYKIQNDKLQKLFTLNKITENSFTDNIEKDSESFYIGLQRINAEKNLETLSQTKNWTEFFNTLNNLSSKIKIMENEFQQLKNDSDFKSFDQAPEKMFSLRNAVDKVTFHGKVIIDNANFSVVNGYNVSELFINSYRRDKKKKIGGIKTLKTVNAVNLTFGKINSISAADFLFTDDLWESKNILINGDIIIESKLNILDDIVLHPNRMSNSTSIKNYNTLSSVPKKTFENIYFDELEILNETNIASKINEQPFILPAHFPPLNINYLETVNQARVELVNVAENLNVTFINEKNFTEFVDQIMYKSNDSKKKFNFTKVNGVIKVKAIDVGNVSSIVMKTKKEVSLSNITENDYNLYSKKRASEFDSNSGSKKIYVFQNLEVNGNLIAEKINKIDWKMFNDIVQKETETNIKGKKIFKNIVKVKRLNIIGRINETFVDNIMTNLSDQTIRFSQKFHDVEFKNLYLKGFWDDIVVESLNHSIVRQSSGDCQTCNFTYVSELPLFIKHLNVSDYYNNISVTDLYDLSKKNLSLTINTLNTSPFHKLKSIKASKATVNGFIDTKFNINGMNLSDLDNIRVHLQKPQVLERDFLLSDLKFDGNLSVKSFNGKNILTKTNFRNRDNVVESILSGKIKKIKNLWVKKNIFTNNGVNNVNLSRFLNNAVNLRKPNAINDTIIFEDKIHFKTLNVTNSIDGINLKKLEKDVVTKHPYIILGGSKQFRTIKVLKHMKTKFLNNHPIQEIVTLKGDQRMKGPFKIIGDVIIKGNVTTNGFLNNIAVFDLLKKFSTHYNTYIFSKDLQLVSNNVKINNLFVGGNIQNASFDALMNTIVFKNESVHVEGKKLFKDEVNFLQNILFDGKINNINFTELLNNMVFINEPTFIPGTIIINEAVLNTLEIEDYFNSSLINNLDVNDLYDDSIQLDRWDIVSGRIKFENVLALENIDADFINNHVSTSTISLKGKQFIPVTALFQRFNVTSDLYVGGYVNSFNLMNEFQNSILLNGSQTIQTKMIFHKNFTVYGNLSVDYIKGNKIEDLITLNTEQTIRNQLLFNGTLIANNNINGLKKINNINLKNWFGRSVLLNREQEIDGIWFAKGQVKTKNIGGNASLGAVNIPEINEIIEKNRFFTSEKKNETESEYYSQCQDVKRLSEELSKLPTYLHDFEIVQVIDTHSVIESLISLKISSHNYVIATFYHDCSCALYKWNKGNSTFDLIKNINIGPVAKWLVLHRSNITYLITSSLRITQNCEDLKPGNIWVFHGNHENNSLIYSGNAFVDIVQENETSDSFFTLEENGNVFKWNIINDTYVEKTFLVNIGNGGYKFIDFKVFGTLALSNGKETKEIVFESRKIVLNTFLVTYNNIVALPIEGKVLVALIFRDKIVVYENIREEKIIAIINTYKASSILWFNYGVNKQSFLIVSSQHKLLEVYEYKNVSGFFKRISLQLFSTKLQSLSLPTKNKHQLSKFIVVIQRSKLIFLEANMLGDYYNDSIC